MTRVVMLLIWLTVSSLSQAQTMTGISARVQAILQSAAAAREAGEAGRERAILEAGLQSVGAHSSEAHFLYGRLASHYADLGNLRRALDWAEKFFETARTPGQEWDALVRLVSLSASLYDKERLQRYRNLLDQLPPRLRSAPNWGRLGWVWQAGIAWAKAHAAHFGGHLSEAEQAYQSCLASARQSLREQPEAAAAHFYLTDCTAGLMRVFMATGRLSAAGAVADELDAEIAAAAHRQKRPALYLRLRGTFAQLAMEQGRLAEARRILLDAHAALQQDPEAVRSLRVAAFELQLAQLAMLEGRWQEALDWHQQRRQRLRDMGDERGNIGASTPDFAYTLIRVGKPAEALAMMQRIVAAREALYDESATPLIAARVFHALALAANGDKAQALAQMRRALPRYLELIGAERSSSEAGVLRAAYLNWMIEGYLELLAEPAARGEIDAIDEAFRLADLARGSTVQAALAAAASRAAITDPALSDLVRLEQDLQREIAALADAIGNLLARGRIVEQDAIVADMRANLARLREQHARAASAIEQRFPDYAALLNPKPVGMATIQGLLKPYESVIAIYSGNEQTLVWAIPPRGSPRFARVALPRATLDQMVQSLRQGLDPGQASQTLPKFRFDLSHRLYQELLQPVAAGWQDAKELIIIPHGRLGQLPFAVLTTAPFSAPPARIEFAEMADAPWLIRRVATTQLPAALALPALRDVAARPPASRPFIGFGDPTFTPGARAPQEATRGGIKRRSLPTAPQQADAADAIRLAPPIDFSLIPPLPDTAQEIEEIATALAADATRDVFLRLKASEAQVKRANLRDYRIVMFATHGLMGGELPGVHQPALALANPALSGDGEDGLLTMEEILALKLQADWVVLSACNTAAAGGPAGESLSGLGRAFFYAGAKSLLVTQWAVETESARLLTTEIFRQQAKHPALPRSFALQQSALKLMKQTAGREFSYAHPMFWAPFTLVGDGS